MEEHVGNLTPARWTMPLLKLGEKRYYLGIFFKVIKINTPYPHTKYIFFSIFIFVVFTIKERYSDNKNFRGQPGFFYAPTHMDGDRYAMAI